MRMSGGYMGKAADLQEYSDMLSGSVAGCVDESERARHFVRLWTLKEAYVKAVGRGIGARPGLKAFSVSLDGHGSGEGLLYKR